MLFSNKVGTTSGGGSGSSFDVIPAKCSSKIRRRGKIVEMNFMIGMSIKDFSLGVYICLKLGVLKFEGFK